MSLLEQVERPPLLRVGLVGCGAVGSAIARAIDSGEIEAELTAVYDADESRTQALVWSLSHATRSMTLAGLIRSSQVVVEATNPAAATSIILQALDGGCDVLVTNPAAVLARREMIHVAQQRGLAIYVPAASLVGLEAMASMEVSEAVFTIEMPTDQVGTLSLPPRPGVEPGSQDQAAVVFEGSAADGAKVGGPLANMIATFALALPESAVGRVKIVANPDAKDFSYGMEVRSKEVSAYCVWHTQAGRMYETANRATSLAAMAALRRMVSALKVG